MSQVFDEIKQGLEQAHTCGKSQWIVEEHDRYTIARCPACGTEAGTDEYTGKPIMSKFCPECGADLRISKDITDALLSQDELAGNLEDNFSNSQMTDQEYLESIPGMVECIREGDATPLNECIPESKVDWNARPIIRVCRVNCNRCGDILEYTHKIKTESPHVLLMFKCKAITVDPVAMATRILYKSEDDFTELHEYWEEPNEITRVALESEEFFGPYISVQELFTALEDDDPNEETSEAPEEVARTEIDPPICNTD